MAEIRNKERYTLKGTPSLNDFLVGTDTENLGQTRSFRLEDIKKVIAPNTLLSGSGVPGETGSNGDFYIDINTNRLYGPKTSGGWGSGISLIGPSGSPGAPGAQGEQGPDGTNITPKGSKPQYADLPTEGNTQGDLWFVEEDGKLYSWDSDSGNWIDLGVIKGEDGQIGSVIHKGSGAPTSSDGVDGDYYIDITNPEYPFYGPKEEGIWPGSPLVLKGEDGAPGTDGKTVLNGGTDPIDEGAEGDFYLNTENMTLFGPKVGSDWGSGIELQGIAGIDGIDGSVIHKGSGIPEDSLGKDGDYYIDEDNEDYPLYGPKEDGIWGSDELIKEFSSVGFEFGGNVYAIARNSYNGDLYVGGQYGQVAKRSDGEWAFISDSLGGLGGGTVSALAVNFSTGEVYAGGGFSGCIAKWDGSVWSSLGEGVSGAVYALDIDQSTGDLYVGGRFTSAGGISANRIAKWDGYTWSALGSGLDNSCQAIAVDPTTGAVYVGGYFTSAGEAEVMRIAVWDNANWSTLQDARGVVGTFCSALQIDEVNRDLYIAGNFTSGWNSDGSTISSRSIIKWKLDEHTFESLGAGVNGTCFAVALTDQGDIIAGGEFSAAGEGVPANNVAIWNNLYWDSLGEGVNGACRAVETGSIYIGGEFTMAGGLPIQGITLLGFKDAPGYKKILLRGVQGTSGIVEVGENENITDATHQDYGKTLTYDADEKKISGNIHSIINEIIPYLGTTYLLDEDGKAIVDENGDFISEIDYDEVAEKLDALLTSLEGGQLGQILTKVNHENFNFIWNTPLIDTNSVIIPIEFPEDTDSPAPDEAEVLAVENKYIRVRRFTGEESTKVSFDFSPPHDMDFTKPIWCRLKGISEISGGVDEYNAVVFSVTGKVLPNDLATPTTSFTTSITYIVPQITDPEFFTTVWEDFIITEGSLDNDVHDYSIQIDLKREYFYGSDAHYTESIAISEIEIKYTKR